MPVSMPHLVQHRDEVLGGDVAGRAGRDRAAAELAEARLERASRPASSAASTLASPCPRVLWKCAVSSTSSPSASRAAGKNVAHLGRVGHPGRVAEADLLRARVAQPARRSRTRARGGTWPSYGQPKATRDHRLAAQPLPRGRGRAPAPARLSDSSTERLTLWRLCVSDADRKTLISWKRSRSAQRVAPARARWGSARDSATSSGTSMRASTSAASASCGITSARTKLVDLEPLQPGARRAASISRDLVVGRDDLGLVLEAVARADLADRDVHACS